MPQPPRTPPTPAEVDRAVAAALRRAGLEDPEPSWLSSLLARAGEAYEQLKQFLADLVPDAVPRWRGALGEAGEWALIGALALVGAVVAARLAVAAAEAWSGRERRSPAAEGGALALAPGARPTRAEGWEEEARLAAAAGQWRDAALALYQALLLRLHERGALRYDPAKTPGDYRREARRRGGVAERPLDAFLRGFEPVAFGRRALDADGYARLRDAAAEGGARG